MTDDQTHRDPNEPGPASAAAPEDLFPSLKRLAHARRRGRVPFVQQTEAADCGAACLTMVLRFLGRELSLDEVREAIGSGRDGADAATIVHGSEWFGLRGRGLSLDVEMLKFLPRGSILHWEFSHFVVLERVTKHGAEIVDPARGTRKIPWKQLRESFTGVALVFEVTEKFEKRKAGAGRLTWYLQQLFGQRRLLARIAVTSLLLRAFALAMPLLTAMVVDRVVPRGDAQLLVVIAGGVGGVLVFQALTNLIRTHLFLQLRTNLDTRLTLGFVDYLARLPFDFFQRRSAGDLMMRVNNNATIRELLTSNTLSALLDGVLVIIYLALIIVLAPVMAAIVGVLALVQITVFLLSRGRYRELQARALDAQARSQSYLVELFAGMATLKACAAEGRAVERWSNLYIDELNVSLERGRVSAMIDGIVGLLSSASPVIILVVGALMVIAGQLTLGGMLAVNAIAMGVLSPLQTLVSSALQLQLIGGYMDRIDDVLKQQPEQVGETAVRAPKLTGRITLQNVSFRYNERAPLVVRDVSVDFKAGMSVAIVGRSGCGKSTLASLIAGLYRPVEGRILYDGHDLARLELKSLRRQLGTVFQSPYLFAGSVRSNIALTDPSLSLDRVVAAARLAHIHDDIDRMPMGYETLLADGGASLSGGQRQRVAIARALVHRPAVLVFDEATSALDGETEARVMENLGRLSCTRIILAHRLSTIVNADLILVMSQGEVVESGTHAELLARNGHYRRLFAAQLHPDDVPPEPA
ncbi:MAG: peptidase domain-containing ABC transporter [Myxococcales bacterium]|nr:peptidase domain-containing ABC transporter [Myxococcales bacterium]